MKAPGIIAIGRNEGTRLIRCLESVLPGGGPVVYVDSRSTDDSVAAAESLGVPVHVLDADRPMNAARARNEGLAWMLSRHPDLELVQFVDGDTFLDPGWMTRSAEEFASTPRLGVAAGHLAELQESRSLLHLLASLEWRRDPGDARATGGIFMGRVEALNAAGGFDPEFPAGEEADLCARVLAGGWLVRQLDVPMGTHDIGDLGPRSWWLRCVRTGYSYAQAYRSGRDRREARSAIAWSVVLPATALAAAGPTGGASLLLLLAPLMHMYRIHRWCRQRGWTVRESAVYGIFTTFAKVPEAIGILRFAWDRVRGVAPRLVRYR